MRSFWLIIAVVLVVLQPVATRAVESPSVADSCMVVSAHPVATRLGLQVLRQAQKGFFMLFFGNDNGIPGVSSSHIIFLPCNGCKSRV